MDDLDVRTGEMQNTLATHAQTTREWQQHSDDQFHHLQEQLREHHDYTAAYYRWRGFDPNQQP